jgi:DNA repair protein RecO
VSYHIYTTNGIILKRTPFGEANILVHVLTEDLGLIMASAQAARKAVSKLRSGLQEYSFVSISCVKGKNGWKATTVREKSNFFFPATNECRRVVAQVGAVLLKMIPGEAPHPEIFHTVLSGLTVMHDLPEKLVSNLEILLVLRLLYHLGYVVSDAKTKIFLENMTDWNDNLLEQVLPQKIDLVSVINKALEASQL